MDVDSAPVQEMLFKTVHSMQHSLQALTLQPPELYLGVDNTPIVSLTFSRLQSLELHGFESRDVNASMRFWLRHGNLERIILWKCAGSWFDSQAISGLLPKVTRLKVRLQISIY